jgi:hypothetical protein
MELTGGYFIDEAKLSSYIFLNPFARRMSQVNEILKYKKTLKDKDLIVNELSYGMIAQQITDEIYTGNYCDNLTLQYLLDQLSADCCIFVVADKDLLDRHQNLNKNKIIYSFALLKIELNPERRIYIDIFCSYQASERFVQDKNRPEGGGSILIKSIRKMAEAMDITIIHLSSVLDKQNWYEKRGFRYIMTHKVNPNKRIKVSLRNKSQKEKETVLNHYNKIKHNDILVAMTRIVPTPEHSPLIDVLTNNNTRKSHSPPPPPKRSRKRPRVTNRTFIQKQPRFR